jgi:hypothetical protein
MGATVPSYGTATATADPDGERNDLSGNISYDYEEGTTLFPIATTTVTASATDDASGEVATCTFTVTVVDSTDPVIISCGSVPEQPVEAASALGAEVAFVAIAEDVVGGVEFTYAPASGTTLGIGTHTVTVTAEDMHHNTSDPCSFVVEVADSTCPVFTACPTGPDSVKVLSSTATTAAVVFNRDGTATDAVSGSADIVIAYDPPEEELFGIGTTVVKVTATDALGNTCIDSACSFDVIVTC